MTGGLAGAAGAAGSSLAMTAITEQLGKTDLPDVLKQGLAQIAAAVNVEANNRQLHQSEYDLAKKHAKLVAQKLGIGELEAEGRILAEMLRNSDQQTAEAAGGIHDYEIRGLVGCQILNCNGYKNDPEYANHNYNAEFIAPNQVAYDSGKAQIETGLTPTEYRSKNIVSERIGKGALAITSCALAGPTICKTALSGFGIALSLNYATGSTFSTAEAIGAAYGGVLGGIYGKNLATWSSETNSFMQSASLWVTKTGSVFGGKQIGTSLGNGAAFGGSVDPLFDSATNRWWGAQNTWNLLRSEK